MILFKKLTQIAAMMLCFLQSGCRSRSPEEAFITCKEAESRYTAAEEKIEQLQKEGALTAEAEATLRKESDALFEAAKAAYADFFEGYINTPYAQQIFAESRWKRRLKPMQLEAVINKVSDTAFMATETYRDAADRLKYMRQSTVGNPYINIVSCDTAGAQVELSQYVGKGKYVLLDFWASWCPDCRREAPALVELYSEYRDRNFEIVGYSLDRSNDAWKKGVEALGITWPQMSDLNYWNSQGAVFYAIQWIPSLILISPDGDIIDRCTDIKALKQRLAELL